MALSALSALSGFRRRTGFFILLIFSARISGSHFNPALTLAFMFRRDTGKFSRLLGILYIAAQYAGALLGSIIVYNLFDVGETYLPLSVGKNGNGSRLLLQAIVQEILGSMIITFLYLTQTEEKTKMSSDPAITTLIIAATYTAVIFSEGIKSAGFGGTVTSGSPVNPAAAFAVMWSIIFRGNLEYTSGTWLYLVFSYIGSMLAVLLFEFIYKKAMVTVDEHDGEDDDDERQEHDALISPKAGSQFA